MCRKITVENAVILVYNVIILHIKAAIGNEAFFRYSSLKSINIPKSVTSIGYDAFNYCSNLTLYVSKDCPITDSKIRSAAFHSKIVRV